jgi:Phage tail tube protein, TTP
MGNIIGRGIKIEVASTYGAAINLTNISQAAQAVVSTATPPVINTVGYFQNVGGMAQVEGQAARAKTVVAATSFVAQGMDTTAFSAFNGTAQFVPVTAWETLAEATAYQSGGGEAAKVNVTRLIDDITQEENGLLAAQSFTIPTIAQDVNSNAMTILEAAALNQGYCVIRITLKSGAVRILRGQPSLPGEDVQQGQAGTGSIGITVKGQILKGVA